MARRDDTQTWQRNHLRVCRLRHHAQDLIKVIRQFETAFEKFLRLEVDAVSAILTKVIETISDEASPAVIRAAEKQIRACTVRVCYVINAITDVVTHTPPKKKPTREK